MAITFDGQNDRITTSSQGLTVPSNVAGTFQAGGLAIGAGSTILTTSSDGRVAIGTATFPSASFRSSLVVNGAIESLRDPAGEGGQVVLRGQAGNIYRWNIDNYYTGSSSQFRIFREDDSTSANGITYLTVDQAGRVLKPLQPYVQLPDTTSYGAVGSLITSPTNCGILQATATQNIGSNWSNSTYTFTCPVDGVYGINVQASIDNVAAGRYIFVLSINGGYEEIIELNNTYQNGGVFKMRKLSTNDTIRFGMNGVSGSNPSYHMEPQIYLLG